MSQRALKKRELLNLHKTQDKQELTTITAAHQIYRKQSQPPVQQKQKFIQRNNTNQQRNFTCDQFKQQQQQNTNLLINRRIFNSTPNLTSYNYPKIQRSHSDTDIHSIPDANRLVNAKSEFHLKSIASTQVTSTTTPYPILNNRRIESAPKKQTIKSITMPHQSKRLSIHSGLSTACSIGSTSTSDSTQPPTSGFADVDNIRIPIIGYEVMEERARFTVNAKSFNFSKKKKFNFYFSLLRRFINYV